MDQFNFSDFPNTNFNEINLDWLAQTLKQLIDQTGGGGSGGTDDYNALRNRPSINNVLLVGNKTPDQLDITAAALGAYVKPSGGIPKTDLASAVQTSLEKADTALQSIPSTYRTAAAQDLIDSGKLDIAQGAGNAGKFMVVGSDGNITSVTMQTWQGGSY